MNSRGTMLDPEDDARYIQFTPEQLQALADFYKAGRSTRSLARRYGISAWTVRRRLIAMGVTMRGKKHNYLVTDQVIETAMRMRGEGRRWSDIVSATGVKSDSIMCAMRRSKEARE